MRLRLCPRLIVALALGGAVILTGAPLSAHFWDPSSRPAPRGRSSPFGNVFEQLWQMPAPGTRRTTRPPRRVQPGDHSKAPPPRKQNPDAKTRILVIGDSMADWLGHGLEEAYADDAKFAVLRSIRADVGLISRGSRRDSFDWVDAAQEAVARQRPHFVAVMLGLADRRSFPETIEEEPSPAQTANRSESARKAPVRIVHREFRSDRWRDLYAKRIDKMIAILKDAGVPLFWVGLPPSRGPRSRSDITYLNDLYRARAERAGVAYVDVWDGFMTEDGKFSLRGPDYVGRMRQLRSADGLHFTKAGALKLGHYAEREIQRVIAARTTPVMPVTLDRRREPGSEECITAPRPTAGPVVSLMEIESPAQELAGSGRAAPGGLSPIARRVLLKGESLPAVAGRADDFNWTSQRNDPPDLIPFASK